MKNLMENKILQKSLLWGILLASAAIIVAALFYSTNFRFFSTLSDSLLTKYINSLASDEWKELYFSSSTKDATLKGYSDFTAAFNKCDNWLLGTGLVGVVSFAVMCIFGNKYRKKYYLSNLIVGVALPAMMAIFTVITIILNINVWNLFADNKHTLEFMKENFDVTDEYPLTLVYCKAAFVIQLVALVVFVLNIVYAVLKYISSKTNSEAELADEEIASVEEVTE
ncbi:MAG: hypothetical protein K6G48_05545 [Acholeplasmatales bacterium]|nr:hypothetical protein [Acholeplasmatales bacterium]